MYIEKHLVILLQICLDFWNWLSSELYRESPFMPRPLIPHGLFDSTGYMAPRRRIYNDSLKEVSAK